MVVLQAFGLLIIIISIMVFLATLFLHWVGFIQRIWPLAAYVIIAIAVGARIIIYGENSEKKKHDEWRAERSKRDVRSPTWPRTYEPQIKMECGINYNYKNVRLATPPYLYLFDDYEDMKKGNPVELVQEPENNYDNKAIMVLYNDEKIGYIFKGKLQGMINDFINRGDDVSAELSKADDNGVYINIEMFKNMDGYT